MSASKQNGWKIFGGSVVAVAMAALFLKSRSEKRSASNMQVQAGADEAEFYRQLREAARLREYACSIAEGKHSGHFERKDYVALALFNRCLQTHEATEIVVKQSLIDDTWVLVRALVEHAVNAVYMLYAADATIANDFNDYQDYMSHQNLLDLKGTDEAMLGRWISPEEEEKSRLRFEAVRGRFDGKRGDKWCPDDALYKRVARVDWVISQASGEKRSDFSWLVNSLWRYASGFTHGTARVLTGQLEETDEGVIIRRKPTYGEAAKVMFSANAALYHVLLPIDGRLGGMHSAEIKRMMGSWQAGSSNWA
jgi:hypothetical protein